MQDGLAIENYFQVLIDTIVRSTVPKQQFLSEGTFPGNFVILTVLRGARVKHNI